MIALPALVRGLFRSRNFSLAVILTLGIGVGAGAAVFALVDLLLLRAPSGIDDGDRVRRLTLIEERPPYGRIVNRGVAWIDYEAVRHIDAVTGAAAVFTTSRSLGRGADAHPGRVTLASASFFPVLGVRPALGRFFMPQEDRRGAGDIPCVAGDGLWRRELGGDGSALGRQLQVGGLTCTVIGVAPKGFSGLELSAIDLWLPIEAAAGEVMNDFQEIWTSDRSHWVRIVARLAPGATEQLANEQATLAYRGFTNRHRDPDLKGRVEWESIVPGAAATGSTNDISRMLLAGCGVLLLLIGANLVNLFLVRDLSRVRETAVRVALGSSRRRLVLDRMMEAGVLALGAGAVALVVVQIVGPVVRSTLLGGLQFPTAALTPRVALVAVCLALAISLVIALISALRAAAANPAELLQRAGSSRSGAARGAWSLRMVLVGLQAMLSVALLVTALAFIRSLGRASSMDVGFDRHNVVVARVPLENLNYTSTAARSFYETLHRELSGRPGITSASLGYMTPWWNNRTEPVSIPGRQSLPEVPGYGVPVFDAVTPDYLTTLGLRLRSGRWLEDQDRRGTAPVIVINEALARLYWPGERPLGQCLRIGADSMPCREVVGVVDNARFTGRLESDPLPVYYLPLAQSAGYNLDTRLFLRTAGDPAPELAPLRRYIQSAAPGLPAAEIFTLEDRFEPLVAAWRLGSYAFTALGLLAAAVGAVGLFSVLSYVVAERRREFAIRAAVGADLRRLAAPVLRQSLTAVGCGMAVGLGAVWLEQVYLGSLLFRSRLTEPLALVLVAGAAMAVAVVASVGPVRDAARQDPMQLLRVE